MASRKSKTSQSAEESLTALKQEQESIGEWVDIDRVRGWDKNPKRHPEAQIKDLVKSIRRFGWGAPLLARPNGELIAGHGRLEAAKQLGLTKVPVRWMNLDPTEAHLLALADNKLTEIGEWDNVLVREILEAAKLEGADIDGLGWNDEELSALLSSNDGETEGLTDPDAAPEPQAQAITRPGDLWLLGKHRVICGSAESDAVALVMDKQEADLLLTDPPYGVSYADKNTFLNEIAGGRRIQKQIENDHRSASEMNKFWTTVLQNAHGSCSSKASYYIFSPQGGDLMMMMSIQEAKWQLKHMLVWVKNNHVLGRCDYHYKHEPIFYGWKEQGTHEFFGGSSCFSVFEFDKPTKNDLHPTMKPVALCARLIENSTRKNGLVLDLFLGSGSTLIAAEQTGRVCYGTELDAAYCDVIVRRWQEFTGKQATLEGDGRTFAEIERERLGSA